MKHIILSILALLALLATPRARAWTYHDGDLLLVFRQTGSSDVEFDLGSVSNLLGHANGFTTNITGWDPSLVTGNFATDLTGVSVILLATTSQANPNRAAWLSGSAPNTTAYSDSVSDWYTKLHSIINGIGTRPLYPQAIPVGYPNAADTNALIINPSGEYQAASYDFIVDNSYAAQVNSGLVTPGQTAVDLSKAIPNLGGNAPFTVEQAIPGRLDFWQINPTTTYPNPPADTFIGSITLATNGVLTFTAGPYASTISGIVRSGNVSTINFSTLVGKTYSVSYTNHLSATGAAWPADTTTRIGDGRTDTLSHTNSDSIEFYRIVTQ